MSLKKLILASHLSSQKDEAKTSTTTVVEGETIVVNEEDDYGAHHDNLSANSDPEGIMKVAKPTNGLDDGEMGGNS